MTKSIMTNAVVLIRKYGDWMGSVGKTPWLGRPLVHTVMLVDFPGVAGVINMRVWALPKALPKFKLYHLKWKTTTHSLILQSASLKSKGWMAV